MKRHIGKIALVSAVALAAIGGTVAYFSDSETSAGNVFKAGKLNLKVDSECSYNGKECVCDGPACAWAGTNEACSCAWEAKDLDGELFFALYDVKPGDYGEDTISLRVVDNDAWVCAAIAKVANADNACGDPEDETDLTCGDPGAGEGELQDALRLTLWRDTDCDNIHDEGEAYIAQDAPFANRLVALADATTGNGPFAGGETYCLGAAWSVPLATGNAIQSDSVTADIVFTAVQHRHMPDFTCASLYAESCDGIDNDLDNAVDEDWPTLGQSCMSGTGVCAAAGTYVCDPDDRTMAVCSAAPGEPADEACDGLDNDCDGMTDDDLAALACALTQGVCAGSAMVCNGAQGWVACGPSEYGPAYESDEAACDGLDNDCDGQTDEDGICPVPVVDFDKDGYGVDTDCDDNSGTVHPGALETAADGIDQDCDGHDAINCYFDGDQDGYGSSVPVVAPDRTCDKSQNESANSNDCNDSSAETNPGAIDQPNNNLDENCSGKVACYIDADNDAYGRNSSAESTYNATGGTGVIANACSSSNSDGWDDTGGDCDDNDASVNPGAEESCDKVDNDCDGSIDESFPLQNGPCSYEVCTPMPGGGTFCAPVFSTYQCVDGAIRCGNS